MHSSHVNVSDAVLNTHINYNTKQDGKVKLKTHIITSCHVFKGSISTLVSIISTNSHHEDFIFSLSMFVDSPLD